MENKMDKIDVVSVRLVKDAPIFSERQIRSPRDIVELLGNQMCEFDREVICIVNLKADGTPINCNFASVGALDQTLAHPRELLKSSILSNASSMIMIHNHPSGNLVPSKQDTMLTDRMIKICELVGIELVDHVIVGGNNNDFYSFNEKNILSCEKNKLTTNPKEISFRNHSINLDTSIPAKQTKKFIREQKTIAPKI